MIQFQCYSGVYSYRRSATLECFRTDGMLLQSFNTIVLAIGVASQSIEKHVPDKSGGVNENELPLAVPVPEPLNLLNVLACVRNVDCGIIPNSNCIDGKCRCAPDFYEHKDAPGMCRLAAGYDEVCSVGGVSDDFSRCRRPFVCNETGKCDCPKGFIQEFFQCIRDCAADEIPTFDGCMVAKQLGGKCTKDEQCVQSYASCLHGICQCIPGANQIDGNCYPVNQCPMGQPARDDDGDFVECRQHNSHADCPAEHYCMFPQMTTGVGFCCPKIRMNCPIGQPLEGHNCSNCPWHTHHCFSYAIGTFTETMCCPNACPTTQPHLLHGRCYAQAAFRGRCNRTEQCASVIDSVCRAATVDLLDEGKVVHRCLCPTDEHINRFGRCIRQSNLGGNCTTDDECKPGTNTVCSAEGLCTCYNGYMPQPIHASAPTKCIAEPSCPTSNGLKPVGDVSYQDCSNDADTCEDGTFCRKWWFDGERTYALCCPKPHLKDYAGICQPFGMRLVLQNEISGEEDEAMLDELDRPSFQDAEPFRCDIALFNSINAKSNDTKSKLCPNGANCLFDPFSTSNSGVCCRLSQTKWPGIERIIGSGEVPDVAAKFAKTHGETRIVPGPGAADPKTNKILLPDAAPSGPVRIRVPSERKIEKRV